MPNELMTCWYCPREFETTVDAWRHMDEEHPVEAAADLERMDAENLRAIRPTKEA